MKHLLVLSLTWILWIEQAPMNQSYYKRDVWFPYQDYAQAADCHTRAVGIQGSIVRGKRVSDAQCWSLKIDPRATMYDPSRRR